MAAADAGRATARLAPRVAAATPGWSGAYTYDGCTASLCLADCEVDRCATAQAANKQLAVMTRELREKYESAVQNGSSRSAGGSGKSSAEQMAVPLGHTRETVRSLL